MEKERLLQPEVNYRSSDWGAFRTYLQQVREDLRNSLENKDHDAITTAFIRGKVSLCKDLLALPRVNETE